MKKDNKQGIFMAVVGVATLLVTVIGATFAYFSINVTGNNTASSIHVTTANVGGVTYSGGTDRIEATNVYPGWTSIKTFTISSDSDVDANAEIEYTVNLVTTVSTLSSAANAATEFVYGLSSTKTPSSKGTTISNKTNTKMPTSNGTTALGSGKLVGPNNVHTYTFAVHLKEMSTSQNHLQGLEYKGIIQVVVKSGTSCRTWNNTQGAWSAYNGSC